MGKSTYKGLTLDQHRELSERLHKLTIELNAINEFIFPAYANSDEAFKFLGELLTNCRDLKNRMADLAFEDAKGNLEVRGSEISEIYEWS